MNLIVLQKSQYFDDVQSVKPKITHLKEKNPKNLPDHIQSIKTAILKRYN